MAENYALLAQLCSGSKLANLDQKQEVELDGFCPRLALLLNKTMTCSGPTEPFGDTIVPPANVNSDPQDIVQSQLDQESLALIFSAVRMNEGFYITPDVVGVLHVSVATGDDCAKRVEKDFALSSTGPMGYGRDKRGIGRNLWTGELSPVVLTYGVKTSLEYLDWYARVVDDPKFKLENPKCYRSMVSMEYFFKFQYSYNGHQLTAVYRLPLDRSNKPKTTDLATSTVERFSDLKALLRKRSERYNIESLSAQMIAIEFNEAGISTDWQNFR